MTLVHTYSGTITTSRFECHITHVQITSFIPECDGITADVLTAVQTICHISRGFGIDKIANNFVTLAIEVVVAIPALPYCTIRLIFTRCSRIYWQVCCGRRCGYLSGYRDVGLVSGNCGRGIDAHVRGQRDGLGDGVGYRQLYYSTAS